MQEFLKVLRTLGGLVIRIPSGGRETHLVAEAPSMVQARMLEPHDERLRPSVRCASSPGWPLALARCISIAGLYALVLASGACRPDDPAPNSRDVVLIPDEPVCATCSLELVPIGRIGSPDDSIYYFMDFLSVAMDSRRNLYLGPRQPRGDMGIDIYRPSGEHVESIARRGSGPEEFPRPYRFLMGRGDSLIVFDLSRTAILSPDWRVSRLITPLAGYVRDAIHLADGGLIAAVPLFSVEAAGMPLHRLAPSGRIVQSFGADDTVVVRPDREHLVYRVIAPSDDGGVWSARLNEYVIELWDSLGVRRRVLRRDADWFRPWQDPVNYLAERPPPGIHGLHRDSANRLWVRLQVADEAWRPTAPERMSAQDLSSLLTRTFDTVIEVIDLNTGALVISQRFPHLLYGLTTDNIVFTTVLDSIGTPYVDVWEIVLVNREPRS